MRFRLVVLVSRLVLAIETLWLSFWPVVLWLGAFVAVALTDVAVFLNPWVHGVLLAIYGTLGVALIMRCVRRLTWPGRNRVFRRIEREQNLAHMPLETLGDAPIRSGDPITDQLWHRHQELARRLVRHVRVIRPRFNLSARDPLALWAGVVLCLIVGGTMGRYDPWARLVRALVPDVAAAGLASPVIDLWITPPVYTHAAPVRLSSARGDVETVQVPEQSTVLAYADRMGETLRLRIGSATLPLTQIDGENPPRVGLETRQVQVLDDRGILASWPIEVIADRAPTIAFEEAPKGDARGRLHFSFLADDDYGLIRIEAVVTREGSADDLRLLLAKPRPDSDKPVAVLRNVTRHPWAGLPVTMTLTARDGAGNVSHSEARKLILPERVFSHPVAKAIVAARRILTGDTAAVRDEAGKAIRDIRTRPSAFDGDSVVFLVLTSAEGRLMRDQSPDAIWAVRDLLWQTALRLEDGLLSLAQRDLDEARDALNRAIEEGADGAELAERIAAVQDAIQRYLAELARTMPGAPSMAPLSAEDNAITSSYLQNMLDDIRDLMATGARDAAMQRLAELNRMLDAFRSGNMARMDPEKIKQAAEITRALRDLVKNQQSLLDQTLRAVEKGRYALDDRSGMFDGLAAEQKKLREDLGNAMRAIGDMLDRMPRSLGRARGAMGDAASQLLMQQGDDAVAAQRRAVQALREAFRQTGQAMARQLSGGAMIMQMGRGQMPGSDPFGRRMEGTSGTGTDGNVDIPGRDRINKARRLLDEIRKRSAQQSRDLDERLYLRRLLELD